MTQSSSNYSGAEKPASTVNTQRIRVQVIVLSVIFFTAVAVLYASARSGNVTATSAVKIGEKASLADTERLAMELEKVIDPPLSNKVLIQPIEPAAAVATRLNEVILPNLLQEHAADFEVLAAIDSRNDRLVRLTASGIRGSGDLAASVMDSAIEELVTDHRSLLDRHLQLAAAKAGVISEVRPTDGAVPAGVETGSNPAAALGALIGAMLDENSNDGRAEAPGETTLVERLHAVSQPTRVMRPPSVSELPPTPSNAVVVVLGLLAGLVAGVSGVLFREFLARARAMRAAQ